MKRATFVLGVLASLSSSVVRADSDAFPDSNPALFESAVAAIDRGAWDDAIDRFELLADRGYEDANASYDRGIAYVRRSQTHAGRPGDLGRAAAAFAETELLVPDDTEASIALERVHQEIARRRAHTHASSIDQKPSLGWAVIGLFREDTWALLAGVGSAVLSVGLAVRLFGSRAALKLAATVVTLLGAGLLVLTAPLALLAHRARLNTSPGVVIVEEARLLTEQGQAIKGPGSVVPEGAEVRIVGRTGTLARVEWGTLDGWMSLGQLRIVRSAVE